MPADTGFTHAGHDAALVSGAATAKVTARWHEDLLASISPCPGPPRHTIAFTARLPMAALPPKMPRIAAALADIDI